MNAVNSYHCSVLCYAVEWTDGAIVQLLLDHQAAINFSISESGAGGSPILSAAYYGKKYVLEVLLSKTDDKTTSLHREALHKAAIAGHTEVVRWLLSHNTPLLSACGARQLSLEIITLLLHEKADVMARDEKGNTPC